MRKLQKRYIYSAIVAGICFIIIYVILDFPLWISLLLSTVLYVGGIFLFKSSDIRVYDAQALAKYQFEMSKLNAYKDKIADDSIKEKIGKIVNHCQKICEHLFTKPTNATKIYNFLDYYLPFTDSIVTKYIDAEKKKDKTFVENKLILKMTVYIREVEQECGKLLSEIIKSKDKAFDFEIKYFEKTSDFELDDDEVNTEVEKNDKGSDKNA